MTTAVTPTPGRRPRVPLPRDRELVVDNFAGAGGASLGIEAALGVPVDVAVNHSAAMIELHAINHPRTRHLIEDVWKVDPLEETEGLPVGLAWFSPDCTHFSRAKGGQPVSKKIRALAWVVIRWAKRVRPRVICLENVPEFQTWGPVGADGRPVADRKGETFRQWVGQLRTLGYAVEWRELCAADYGVPTTRRRFFLVARCDGEPIRWPAATHAPRERCAAAGLLPWRAAAECIDWSLPCPSIFERKRALAEATQRRIALGIKRYVLEAADPFIVPIHYYHGTPRSHALADPMPTITAWPKGGAFSLVAPTIVRCAHGEQSATGRRWGRGAQGADEPLPTVTASKDFALVSAFLAKHYGGVVGHGLERPLGTVTAVDHHSLVTAHLAKLYGTCRHGQDCRDPMPTITGGGGHVAEVRAFLVKYFGTCGHGQDCRDPLHTVTGKHRFGLVTVAGVEYQLADIGLRMLEPHELLRAQFGRHADRYTLTGTKARQVAAIGNSVPPELAEAIVRANVALRGVGVDFEDPEPQLP